MFAPIEIMSEATISCLLHVRTSYLTVSDVAALFHLQEWNYEYGNLWNGWVLCEGCFPPKQTAGS